MDKPPKFNSEKEEAEWWDAHPEFILSEFERAKAEGRLGRGTMMAKRQEKEG